MISQINEENKLLLKETVMLLVPNGRNPNSRTVVWLAIIGSVPVYTTGAPCGFLVYTLIPILSDACPGTNSSGAWLVFAEKNLSPSILISAGLIPAAFT